MELNLLYVHSPSIGYGRLGMELSDVLRRRGVDVYDDLPVPDHVRLSSSDRKVNDGARSGVCDVVCWVSVPTHARGWWAGQHPIIFTMWEAMKLPPSFRENLHNFAQVLVPSDQNVELFSQYHPDVRRVLLGVDPGRWHYTPRDEPGQWFNFLIGGSGPRKGTDLAYQAFVRVFGKDGSWSKGPTPRLIMKSPKGEPTAAHDRVIVMSGRVTAEEEIALYESAHCYLQPSRGEGFGLQPLQAIAQGCPTILTDAHGHESFAHLGYGLSTRPVEASYFIYGDAGDWWEPDFDELCEAMRAVYDDYTLAAKLAAQSAAVVARDFTWDNCADQFLDAVGVDRMGPYSGGGGWFEPKSQRFLVVTNRTWRADIAGVIYQFDPGREYWETADVKRILYEGEVLDPTCLEGDDTGLTEDQLKRRDTYSAAHGNCQACQQPLNMARVG